MGRKLPFLISTLIMAASSLSTLSFGVMPASAEQITIDGTEYWPIDEVMAESENYLSDIAKCNDDDECKSNFEVAYLLAGGKYSAAASFSSQYFLITAINPSKSTITVYFNDKSATEFALPGTDTLDVIKTLCMFWWENGTPEYGVRVFDGTTGDPNRHEFYFAQAESEEAIFPANVEYEIKLEDFDFTILEDHNLYYMVKSEMSDMFSGRNYQSCLKEIHGLDNYECRAAMDYMGNTAVYPTEVKTVETDITDESKTAEATETTETTNTADGAEATGVTESVEAMNITESQSGQTPSETSVVSTSVMKVPEYITIASATTSTEAQPSREEKESATLADSAKSTNVTENYNSDDYVEVPLAATKQGSEFPWWLVALAFAGVSVVTFWFILIRSRLNEE